MAKRQVEVFTAGCPVCDPAVQLVRDMACPDCEVTVYNLHEGGMDKAKGYGVTTVPAIVVNGQLAACCQRSAPSREQLAAAGIGQRLG